LDTKLGINNNSNKPQLSMLVFSILLLLGSLNITRSTGITRELAIACVLYGSSILFIVLVFRNKSIKINWILILIVVGIYLLGTVIYEFQIKGFKVFLQVTLLLVYFFTMYQLDWREKRLQYLSTMFLLFTWICLMQWVGNGMPIGYYKGHVANQNGFGSMLFLSLFFLLIPLVNRSPRVKRLMHTTGIITALLLIYASGARAAWLSVLVTFIVFTFWKLLTKGKTRFKIFFLIFIIGLVIAFTTYIQLPMTPLGNELNKMVFHITGQRLFSGRQSMWPILLDAITHRPWFGYGAGTTPGDISWITLSAHNWYLQTALQVGLIGLMAFVVLFYSLWKLFWRGRNDPVVKLAASFMIGILFHQMFEVSLTQNSMGIALLQWLIIAIACSRSVGFSYDSRFSES